MADNENMHQHHGVHTYSDGGLLGGDVTVFDNNYRHAHDGGNKPHSHAEPTQTHQERDLTIPVPPLTEKQYNAPGADEPLIEPSRKLWWGEE